MKRNKLTNVIGSMLMGVVFMITMLLVLIISGAVSLQRTDLVFSTESASAMYDGKPLTNHTWTLAAGELKAGHRAMVTFTGSQTSVGESDNSIQVKILDAANADVTGDYSISYNFGKLKVNPRMLTVKSEGGTKVYDGLPLINTNYTVSELIPGHNAVVIVMGSQTQIGHSPNTISMVKIIDRTGADVTFNYQLTKIEQPLIVTNENGGSGGQGSLSAGGVDFSGSSNLLPSEGLENSILYRVYANRTGMIYLKFKSYGDYTGTGFAEATEYTSLAQGKYAASYLTSFALQNSGATRTHVMIRPAESKAYVLPYYMSATVYSGYDVQKSDIESIGSANEYRLDLYEYNTTPVLPSLYTAYERNYRNFVYKNYLEIDGETLAYFKSLIDESGFDTSDSDIVEKVARFIQGSAKYDMEYDRAMDDSENIAIAFLKDYKTGVCKHYAMAATMFYRALGIPARYTIGVVADAKASQWVDVTALQAHAWVEVYRDGIGWVRVEVTGGYGDEDSGDKPEISPVSVDKVYNGTPLYPKAELKGFDTYAKLGYTYKDLRVSGSQTAVGRSESVIENIVIYDPQGKDVTKEFRLVPGKIHVYKYEITMQSASASFTYGNVISNTVTLVGSRLQPGHKYTASFGNHPVGMHSNTFDVVIKDAYGNVVTDQYKINKVYGTLVVNPRTITVTAGSATKKYDGSELTDSKYTVTGKLAEGDRVAFCTVEGTQTNVGRAENVVVKFIIHNSRGEDVTDNYNVIMVPGALTVTRK